MKCRRNTNYRFCAVLAFAAVRNNDKVGLIFTDQIELFIPPKKGSSHVLRLIRELLYFKMLRKKTDSCALDYLGRVTRRRRRCFWCRICG